MFNSDSVSSIQAFSLRDCSKCHEGQSYAIPLPSGVRDTIIILKGQVIDAKPPTQAICSGCHASQTAAARIETITSAKGGEVCAVCHGRGAGFRPKSQTPL